MAATEKRVEDANESRRSIIIMVAVISAVVIAGLFYLLMRATGGGGGEPRLEGAIRPGSPEFEQYRQRIVLDQPEAEEAKRAFAYLVISSHTTAHHLPGPKTNGLESRGPRFDHQDKPGRSR